MHQHVFLADLIEKTGRQAFGPGSEEQALAREAEMELYFRPGYSDVAESAFLLDLFDAAQAAGVGEQTLLQPRDEDVGKFQPFGGVERHQRDRVPPDPAGEGVGGLDQRHVLKELRQGPKGSGDR